METMHRPMLRWLPVLAILLTNLLAGVFVSADFGESWDEHLRYQYAERSLGAYAGQPVRVDDEKGPFYVMLARLGSDALQRLVTGLPRLQAWHWMHFLSFQMGLIFLYLLCLRWMSIPAAVGAVLLFNTQPLLWGHAWINPKDIPFMAFFLGSLVLGLRMADSAEKLAVFTRPPGIQSLPALLDEDRRQTRRRRWVVLLASLAGLGLLLGLVLRQAAIQDGLADLVTRAFRDGNTTLAGRVFLLLAQRAAQVPVDLYAEKARLLVPWGLRAAAGLVLALHAGLAVLLFPRTTRGVWQGYGLPFLRAGGRNLARGEVILAGVFLGFSSAIRVLGPFSGLMVAVFALKRSGRRVVPALAVYALVAFIVTVAAWPSLWGSPFQNYLQSVSTAADFPWEGKVMFNGVDYAVDALPRSYLPTLLGLQFTETALLCFGLGLVVGVGLWRREERMRPALALLGTWFLLPILTVVLLQPTIYDNFRQFLFTIPPMFVFAGLGLDALFRRLSKPVLFAALLAILLLPGVYWGVRLHPYPYTYYNLLAGGPQGAFRRFETDYWATSYKEAGEYVNMVAPQGAVVVVWGADHLVQAVARPDLEIIEYRKADGPDQNTPVYAVISTRHNKDQALYPGSPVLFQVERVGVIYAVVKQLQTGGPTQP